MGLLNNKRTAFVICSILKEYCERNVGPNAIYNRVIKMISKPHFWIVPIYYEMRNSFRKNKAVYSFVRHDSQS